MWSQSLLHQGVCFIWPYRSKYGSTITGVSIPSSSGGVLHVDRQSQLRQSKGSQSLLHQGVCFINTTTNTGGKRHDHDVSIPSSSGGVLHKIGWWRHRDGGIALSQSLLHQGVCFIRSAGRPPRNRRLSQSLLHQGVCFIRRSDRHDNHDRDWSQSLLHQGVCFMIVAENTCIGKI